jgi:hypothetical protein
LRDAVTIPTSTLATPPAITAEQPTTRTPESLPEAAQDTLSTSIAARARQIAVASFTIPTRTQVSLLGRTTSMRAKTAPCTATTEITVVGRATVATAGNPSTSRSQSCKPNSKCAAKARSVPRTSTRCAVTVALAWEGVDGGSRHPPRAGNMPIFPVLVPVRQDVHRAHLSLCFAAHRNESELRLYAKQKKVDVEDGIELCNLD